MDLDKFIETAEKRSHQRMDSKLRTLLKLTLYDIEKNIKIKLVQEIDKLMEEKHGEVDYEDIKKAIKNI